MLYILILIYIIYLSIRYPRLNNKSLGLFYLLFIIFALVAGLRYNLGTDTYAYTKEYKTFPTLFQLQYSFIKNSPYQIFWILFESSLRTITKSFYLLQTILAIFVNFVVFRTIRKYSLNPFFSILLYYILFYLNLNMEIIRESISICLLLIGVGYISEKKYIKYYVLATIAFLFHESGLVLFIVPAILNINISKKAYVISITLLILFSGLLSIYFLDYLSKINFILGLSKINYYTNISTNIGFPLFNYVKYVFLPVSILFVFYNCLNDYEKKYIFIYVIFSILFIQIFIFYRIRDYFLIFLIISFTNSIIIRFGNKSLKLLLKLLSIFVFIFIFMYRYYYSASNPYNYQLYLNYYPYNSIINEEIPSSRLNNYIKVLWLKE